MSSATEPDPYLVLELPRTATAAEVRAAYRAAGARYHPDRHQGNPLAELAGAKMAEINRAYEILSNPESRAAFDRGERGGRGASGTARSVNNPAGSGNRAPAHKRFVGVVAALSLLPLMLRFGGLIVRGIAAAVRAIGEGLALIRGTPFLMGAVLLASTILAWEIVRRRRR
jgi:molecular chaperone DnaJ